MDEHGEPSSTSDCERYRRSARKEEQKRSLGAPAQATTTATELQPSTSKEQHSMGLETRPKQARQKTDRQSSYPEPADGPECPLSPDIVAVVRRQSKVRPRAASARRPKPTVRAEWLQSLSSRKTDSRCIKMMISFNDTINKRSKSMYTSFCES